MGNIEKAAMLANPAAGAAILAGKGTLKTGEWLVKYPEVVCVSFATAVAIGGFTLGYLQSQFATSIETEQVVTVVDEGYADVVEVRLDIPDYPMMAFDADGKGKRAKAADIHKGEILGKDFAVTDPRAYYLDMETRVVAETKVDTTQITAGYDARKKSDKTDDRIILTVPLEAIGIESRIDVDHEDTEFIGNPATAADGVIAAIVESNEDLEDFPGIGHVKKTKDAIEKSLTQVMRLQYLHDITQECTPKVISNENVYKGIKANIANVAPLAIRDTTDPTLIKLKTEETAEFVENMEIVVRLGAENDAQPFLPTQKLEFNNPYSEAMKNIEANKNITFVTPEKADESEEEFVCNINDSVEEMLASRELNND